MPEKILLARRSKDDTSTCQHSIDQLEQRPLATGQHLDKEKDNKSTTSCSNQGGDDGTRHCKTISRARYRRLGTAVEGKEAEDEDERSETDERNGVSHDPRTVDPLDFRTEPSRVIDN